MMNGASASASAAEMARSEAMMEGTRMLIDSLREKVAALEDRCEKMDREKVSKGHMTRTSDRCWHSLCHVFLSSYVSFFVFGALPLLSAVTMTTYLEARYSKDVLPHQNEVKAHGRLCGFFAAYDMPYSDVQHGYYSEENGKK